MKFRFALAGEAEALEWIVSRFSPMLKCQARVRLTGTNLDSSEAEDLVGDVWAVALPRLADIEIRNGSYSPCIIGFLSKILINRHSELLRREIRRVKQRDRGPRQDSLLRRLPAETRDAVRRASQGDLAQLITYALQCLSDDDRSVLVLRGMEGLSNAEAAERLGLEASTVAVRYHRAKSHFAERVPKEIYRELELQAAEYE
ncbi:MAG: sigma-70 family RNA polymerase sigma factor [Planctomycetota bacterium]